MLLLVATAKGLIVFEKKNRTWRVKDMHFVGLPVSMIFIDERTDTWWAGTPHRHWGQKLHRSKDFGKNWEEITAPRYPTTAFSKNGKPAALKLIWCMANAGNDKPNELWLGTEPGGLFHSSDNGNSFQLVESLWNHPSRSELWFGAGKDEPFIHSIVVDPRNSNHVYIAVSCAGVFETTDAGKNWQPRNVGLKATYLPNPNAEVGHDPHLLLACKAAPDILWQQNHCGIFRSINGGATWQDVSNKRHEVLGMRDEEYLSETSYLTPHASLPNYGFALAIDNDNPLRAWTIPAVSDEMRVPHNLALCVCRTDNGGNTWQQIREGLPQKNCFDIVFRHAFAIRKNTLAFGTTNGNLYVSENFGDSWKCIHTNLARVDAVVLVKKSNLNKKKSNCVFVF